MSTASDAFNDFRLSWACPVEDQSGSVRAIAGTADLGPSHHIAPDSGLVIVTPELITRTVRLAHQDRNTAIRRAIVALARRVTGRRKIASVEL